LPESTEYEFVQRLFGNIRGQTDVWTRRCDICNRNTHASVHRCCQKCVDVARIRPAKHDCHARDLSALVDLVSHGCEEAGTGRKQRPEVGRGSDTTPPLPSFNRTSRFPASRCRRINRQLMTPVYPRAGLPRGPQEAVKHPVCILEESGDLPKQVGGCWNGALLSGAF
jgi:hypothetical protein